MPPADREDLDSYLRTNDFEILEHFLDDGSSTSSEDIPPPVFHASGFPKAKHRSVSEHALSKPQEYQDVVLKPLEQMSLAEIEEARKHVLEKLGPKTCEFLKERALKRLDEQGKDDHPGVETRDGSSTHDKDLVFKIDRKEFKKYEWMAPNESFSSGESKELMLHELRFNFDGELVEGAEGASYDPSLHNHGMDPDKPGYTLPELLHLAQSRFKPQVQIAVRTLANLLYNSFFPRKGPGVASAGVETGQRPFFGYPQYRWNRYIYADLDLVSKAGYLVVANQTSTAILIDSLRLLSLLIFGDYANWNRFGDTSSEAVLPVEETRVSHFLCSVHSVGYDWNPVVPDLMDLVFSSDNLTSQVRSGSFKAGEALVAKREAFLMDVMNRGKEFGNNQIYSKLFPNGNPFGLAAGSDSEEPEKGKKEAGDSEEPEPPAEFRHNSLLYLLCNENLLTRILRIMDNNRENLKVQIYGTSCMCGFVRHFKKPLAKALASSPSFKSQYNWLLNAALELAGEGSKELTCVFLQLVKTLSTYCTTIPSRDTVTILIKGTITRVWSKELRGMNVIFGTGAGSEDPEFKRLADIGLCILIVWAREHGHIEPLAELTPLIVLSVHKMTNYLTRAVGAGTDSGGECRDDHWIEANWELVVHLIMHHAICTRVDFDEHGQSFQAAALEEGFTRLIQLFSCLKRWSPGTLYFLFVLLSHRLTAGSELWEGLSIDCLLDLFKNLVEYSVSVYAGDRLTRVAAEVLEMAWLDDEVCGPPKPLLYNEAMVRGLLNDFLLPFSVINLVSFMALVMLRHPESKGSRGDPAKADSDVDSDGGPFEAPLDQYPVVKRALGKEEVKEFSDHLKSRGMFKPLMVLYEATMRMLKYVYHELHFLKPLHLDAKLYPVKTLPVFDQFLSLLTFISPSGHSDPDLALAVLATGVNYRMIGNYMAPVERMLGADFKRKRKELMRVFRNFNNVAATLGFGDGDLTSVSALSFMAHLPLYMALFSEPYGPGSVGTQGSKEGGENVGLPTGPSDSDWCENVLVFHLKKNPRKLAEWVPPSYLFHQVAYSLAHSSFDYTDNLGKRHLKMFELFLFRQFSDGSGTKPLDGWNYPDAVTSSRPNTATDSPLGPEWSEAFAKFRATSLNPPSPDELKNRRLVQFFVDANDMASCCSSLIQKYKGGQLDSPVTIGLFLLYISKFSTEECWKLVCSDRDLLLLIGRNSTLDLGTFEILAAGTDLVIGHLSAFSQASLQHLKADTDCAFTDREGWINNPVLFLTMASTQLERDRH